MTVTPYAVPDGERITINNGRLHVPERPIIPFVEGDGTGPDIWRAVCACLMPPLNAPMALAAS